MAPTLPIPGQLERSNSYSLYCSIAHNTLCMLGIAHTKTNRESHRQMMHVREQPLPQTCRNHILDIVLNQ